MACVSSIATISAPVIAAQAIFSARRVKKGSDAMEKNPVEGILNEGIAGGQMLKGITAAKAIEAVANPISENGATNTIKAISEKNKIAGGACKVAKFTANNINPIICVASLASVLGADDKKVATFEELLALGGMFGAEAVAKRVLGMPITTIKDWKQVSTPREALYKKSPFATKQVEALQDFCATKKFFNNKVSIKALPSVLKGLSFALASIVGYKTGLNIAKSIINDNKKEK